MDCQKRPTHTFKTAAAAMDEDIAAGHIPRAIPYIKREGMRLLQAGYETREEAEVAIPAGLATFYNENYPDQGWTEREEFKLASEQIAQIYLDNIFPEMLIDWGTYPNHIGHTYSPGCFRCHDEEHTAASGLTISQDCENCHSLLAYEEENPEILETLFP